MEDIRENIESQLKIIYSGRSGFNENGNVHLINSLIANLNAALQNVNRVIHKTNKCSTATEEEKEVEEEDFHGMECDDDRHANEMQILESEDSQSSVTTVDSCDVKRYSEKDITNLKFQNTTLKSELNILRESIMAHINLLEEGTRHKCSKQVVRMLRKLIPGMEEPHEETPSRKQILDKLSQQVVSRMERKELKRKSKNLGSPGQKKEGSIPDASTIPVEEKIFEALFDKYMNMTDLKSLRQVNTFFNRVATRSFLKRIKNCHHSFTYDPATEYHIEIINSPFRPRRRILEELTNCLNFSKITLPLSSFSFFNAHLESIDLQIFFRIHGRNVKHLELELNFDEIVRPEIFGRLLCTQLPQLESFHIWPLPYHWGLHGEPNIFKEFNSRFQDPDDPITLVTLPSLKHFRADIGNNPCVRRRQLIDFVVYDVVVAQILMASVNLITCQLHPQLVFGVKSNDCLNVLVDTNKIHLINRLLFGFCEKSLKFYKNCSRSTDLKLTEIDIYSIMDNRGTGCGQEEERSWIKSLNVLQKILEASQSSLKIIRLYFSTTTAVITFDDVDTPYQKLDKFFISKMNWPILPSLEALQLNLPSQKCTELEAMFTKPVSLMFPFLHTVIIVEPMIVGYIVKSIFPLPLRDVVPTVKNLEITLGNAPLIIPPWWFHHLPLIFPNVANLAVRNCRDFPRVSSTIWKFSKVESLSLGIRLSYFECPNNTFPALDSAFTGFSYDWCRKLYFAIHRPLYFGKLRINNSNILNMKELDNLEIIFEGADFNYELTHLSLKYAFRLLPKRCVGIKIFHKNGTPVTLEF